MLGLGTWLNIKLFNKVNADKVYFSIGVKSDSNRPFLAVSLYGSCYVNY